MESKHEESGGDEEGTGQTNKMTRLSFALEHREETGGKCISIVESSSKDETFIKKIYYTITGSDNLGSFTISRRFNEFFLLRSVLVDCWPGFYIPKIPAKQKIVKDI